MIYESPPLTKCLPRPIALSVSVSLGLSVSVSLGLSVSRSLGLSVSRPLPLSLSLSLFLSLCLSGSYIDIARGRYPYDGCHDKEGCYSPSATSLSASCSGCTGEYLAIKFVNNKRNMQLLLPLTITINEIAWGLPFLLLFGLAAGFYIGGGIAMGVRRAAPAYKGSGLASTLAVHLHYRHWVEVAALCADGALFASRKAGVGGLGGTGKRYTPVTAGAAPPPHRTAATEPSSRKSKSSRDGKREKGEKKQKSGKRDKDSSGEASPPVASAAAAPAPAPAPAGGGLPGTAAGGGGRWVHVPN